MFCPYVGCPLARGPESHELRAVLAAWKSLCPGSTSKRSLYLGRSNRPGHTGGGGWLSHNRDMCGTPGTPLDAPGASL